MKKHLLVMLTWLFVFPSFSQELRLPGVTGPFPVGTVTQHWIDMSRENKFTRTDPNDFRELMVQIWYPASIDVGDQVQRGIADMDILGPALRTYIPLDLENVMSSLHLNTYPGARISSELPRFPVLIYSHGPGGYKNMQEYLMEELASHGYVVVAIDHTYDAAAVRFPDGHVIRGGQNIGNVRSSDIKFVLDQLERINTGDSEEMLKARFLTSRMGVIGVSNDSRLKAGLSIGMGLSEFAGQRLSLPYMEMSEFTSARMPQNTILDRGGYFLSIQNASHQDFNEGALYWTVAGLPGRYPHSTSDDPIRITRVEADYAIAFFDKHLKGKTVPLLNQECDYRTNPHFDYPEVLFRIIGSPQRSGIRRFQFYE